MRLIELNKLKKIKVGFEDVSELIVPNYKILETNIVTTVNAVNENRTFIMELMLPANACYYALLGARYIPAVEHKGLNLEVRYSDSNTENYKNTLAYSERTVFKGLAKEYVETVLNTATDYLRQNTAPSGKIVFDTAAYCEVGSSPLIFKIATKIVLQSLLNEQYPVSDGDIKDICEKYLKERV